MLANFLYYTIILILLLDQIFEFILWLPSHYLITTRGECREIGLLSIGRDIHSMLTLYLHQKAVVQKRAMKEMKSSKVNTKIPDRNMSLR